MPKAQKMVSIDPDIIAKAKARNINFSATLENALRAEFADTSPMDEKIMLAGVDVDKCREALVQAAAKEKNLIEAKAKLAEDERLAKEKADAEAVKQEAKLAMVRASLIGWVKAGTPIKWPHYLEKYGIMEQEIKGLIENETVKNNDV